MGAGTGGTISGIGRRLKEKCPSCKVRYKKNRKRIDLNDEDCRS